MHSKANPLIDRTDRPSPAPSVESQLAAVCAAAEILCKQSDKDCALNDVLAAVAPRLNFEFAALWVRDADEFRRDAVWGAVPDESDVDRLHRVCKSGEPECSPMTFAVPIRRGTEAVGVIEFGPPVASQSDANFLSAVVAIAQQVGQFVARAQAEEALTATTAEHHILFDNANDAFGVSVDERFVYVNRAFADMFGYEHPDQVVGVSIYDNLPPAQQDIVREHRERRLAGLPEPMRYHSRGRREDGSEFLSEVRATDYWINGKMYTLAILRDITAERNAQDALNASVTALKRANADLEQFAYAASHDLQEPLRVIALYSELLRRRHQEVLNEDATELLATVTNAARRISDLVKDLLAYTQTASLDATVPSVVDPNDVINDVRDMLRDVISTTNATVTSDMLPNVRVHRMHLVQLFQNLVTNALKYHKPDEPPSVHLSAQSANDWVELVFRDKGIGIPPEYHERIFGVFRRLHSQRVPGTGIGLAICKKIVDYYGGTIRVESTPGEGAAFVVRLPAAA